MEANLALGGRGSATHSIAVHRYRGGDPDGGGDDDR